MTMRLSGFFPDAESARLAIQSIAAAQAGASDFDLADPEKASAELRNRAASARFGRAAAGAVVCGGLTLVLSAIVFTFFATGSAPWTVALALTASATTIGGGLGAFYGTALQREATLLSLRVPAEKLRVVRGILRAAGGCFVRVSPA